MQSQVKIATLVKQGLLNYPAAIFRRFSQGSATVPGLEEVLIPAFHHQAVQCCCQNHSKLCFRELWTKGIKTCSNIVGLMLHQGIYRGIDYHGSTTSGFCAYHSIHD